MFAALQSFADRGKEEIATALRRITAERLRKEGLLK